MIEAIGHKYLDTYFAKCAELLKPEGMMLLQAITIADQRYSVALKSVDFIQRYIFPGGFLPSVTAMLHAMTKSSDMRLYHLEDIGAHGTARTLKCWRGSFIRQIRRIRAMGYSDAFLRMWNYYYCYCEGASHGTRDRQCSDVAGASRLPPGAGRALARPGSERPGGSRIAIKDLNAPGPPRRDGHVLA